MASGNPIPLPGLPIPFKCRALGAKQQARVPRFPVGTPVEPLHRLCVVRGRSFMVRTAFFRRSTGGEKLPPLRQSWQLTKASESAARLKTLGEPQPQEYVSPMNPPNSSSPAKPILFAGLAVMGVAVLWWLVYYGQHVGWFSLLRRKIGCLYGDAMECGAFRDFIGPSVVPVYSPVLMWVGTAAVAVGLYLNRRSKH